MANFKSNYTKVRNATWVYYLLAFVFFIFAVQAFPSERWINDPIRSLVRHGYRYSVWRWAE